SSPCRQGPASGPCAPDTADLTRPPGPCSAGPSRGSPTLTRDRAASSPTTGPTCPTSATSPPSTGPTLSRSTSSPPATPASRSASPENAKEPQMTAISGRTSPPPFAYYDPDSACLRTSQGTFDLGLPTSSPTLPRSGSMRSGRLYERPMSEPHTSASAFSSSPNLPTPAARDFRRGRPRWHLPTAVTTLPTPTMGASRNPRNATANRTAPKPTTNTGSSTLSDVAHLMPTPRTTDANGGGQHGTGGPDLRTAVARIAADTERVPGKQRRHAAPDEAPRSEEH